MCTKFLLTICLTFYFIHILSVQSWNSYCLFIPFVVTLCDKIYRVQQESAEDGERNHFLVNYVDYAFDDFGGRQPPVYPGLSTVWGSLARSKVVLTLCYFIQLAMVHRSFLF